MQVTNVVIRSFFSLLGLELKEMCPCLVYECSQRPASSGCRSAVEGCVQERQASAEFSDAASTLRESWNGKDSRLI